MKTIKIKTGVVTLLCAVVLAGLTACDADPVERMGGKLPDKDPLENTYGVLRSSKSSGSETRMNLTEGAGFVTDNIYFQITQPASTALSLDARIDPALVDVYNAVNETNFKLLPEANYEFPDGKTLVVARDGKRSEIKRLKVLAGSLEPGEYLLPVTVAKTGETAEKLTMYYRVAIRARQMGDYELNADQVFSVFYINTSMYDPRLVDEYFMRKESGETWEEVWYRTIGNIINLRTVVLDYDAATGRAKLNLGADMTYVLDHADKYIRPLQDKGRKVCLALEGGGKGLGFCNMTDVQINDFVAQVKTVVEVYELDGVNLWDQNSGYGKEGMPAMNTTSYPKLIKALRTALGTEKLLTVTDHLEPTEYFWDTAAMGGIEVGQYLDYAWSGYRTANEAIEIVDPWHQGAENVSTLFARKPIAGLAPSKYGCINVPWYFGQVFTDQLMQNILYWRQAGYKQSPILVFEDLRTVIQDKYEGVWESSFTSVYGMFCDDGMFAFYDDEWGGWGEAKNFYMFDGSQLGLLPSGLVGYNKWLKEW